MPSAASRDIGKLFGLKSWVELAEAASALSILIGEQTSRGDILRLGLDGHLKLSVRFVTPAAARPGRTIPLSEATRTEIPTLDGNGHIVSLDGTPLPGDRVMVFEDKIVTIVDVWDLPMVGGERLEIENLYERDLLRHPAELFNLEGTFVNLSDGTCCELMERFEREVREPVPNQPYHPSNFYPAAGLPHDSVVVVRTQALRDFASGLAKVEGTDTKPLERRERTTLLVIIAALAKLAKIDLAKPSSAAAAIENQTELLGARVASRTIEDHLKRVADAIESRS